MMYWILLVPLIAFVVTIFLTRLFCHPSSKLYLLDHPNERSLHSRPTPRTGGVAILFGFLSVTPISIFAGGFMEGWLLAGLAIVAGLSFWDDWHGLSVRWRLFGQLVGASIVVLGAELVMPPILPMFPAWLVICLSIIFLVWMVNLYNFMDGMDGFAGGMAVIGFGAFAIFGMLAGNLSFVVLNLGLSAAAGGFLLFNFPPARIFMGDVGSASLGLLAGIFILWGVRDSIFPFWIGILIFSPFIVDASVTLLTRISRRERFWQAHKTHYYQRLVLLGWGHRRTVLTEYALMLSCVVSTLWMVSRPLPIQLGMLIFWAFIYVVLAGWIDRLERRGTTLPKRH